MIRNQLRLLSLLSGMAFPALGQANANPEIGWFEDLCLDDRTQACSLPENPEDFGWYRQLTNSRSSVEKGMKEILRKAKLENRPVLLMGGDYC